MVTGPCGGMWTGGRVTAVTGSVITRGASPTRQSGRFLEGCTPRLLPFWPTPHPRVSQTIEAAKRALAGAGRVSLRSHPRRGLPRAHRNGKGPITVIISHLNQVPPHL